MLSVIQQGRIGFIPNQQPTLGPLQRLRRAMNPWLPVAIPRTGSILVTGENGTGRRHLLLDLVLDAAATGAEICVVTGAASSSSLVGFLQEISELDNHPRSIRFEVTPLTAAGWLRSYIDQNNLFVKGPRKVLVMDSLPASTKDEVARVVGAIAQIRGLNHLLIFSESIDSAGSHRYDWLKANLTLEIQTGRDGLYVSERGRALQRVRLPARPSQAVWGISPKQGRRPLG